MCNNDIYKVTLQIINQREAFTVFTTYLSRAGKEYDGFEVCKSIDDAHDLAEKMVELSPMTDIYTVKEWDENGARLDDSFVHQF